MARSRPVLLTAALSVAAVLGYLTYRGLLGDADQAADDAGAAATASASDSPGAPGLVTVRYAR